MESHQAAIDQVNEAGKKVISSEGGADASTTRHNLDSLNSRWETLLTKTKNWQMALEDALREALDYQSALSDMVMRLSEIDGQLSASKPVGGLPETAKEQLQEFMVRLYIALCNCNTGISYSSVFVLLYIVSPISSTSTSVGGL